MVVVAGFENFGENYSGGLEGVRSRVTGEIVCFFREQI
jgi:hypothetical protein